MNHRRESADDEQAPILAYFDDLVCHIPPLDAELVASILLFLEEASSESCPGKRWV